MDRRRFLLTAAGVAAAPLAAGAQQAGKVWRIGTLSGRSPGADSAALIGTVRDALKQLGYVEARNVVFEDRFAEGHVDRFPQLAEELVRLKVDVIVAHGTAQALAARNATRTIPIVGVVLAGPVEAGLLASLSRPGGNVTGLTMDTSPDQAAKPLEFITALTPRQQRITIVFNSAYPGLPLFVDQMVAAGPHLHVKTDLLTIERPSDVETLLRSLREGHRRALLIVVDPVIAPHVQQITAIAMSRSLPLIYVGGAVQQFAASGALMGYGPDVVDLLRRAAVVVDRILKGSRPADIPVEQPTKFNLAINLKTAKALSLTIPPSLLARADHIIE